MLLILLVLCLMWFFPDYGILEEHIIAHFLRQIGEWQITPRIIS